jgi:hypothetical protein
MSRPMRSVFLEFSDYGPPEHGDSTVLAHAYLSVPTPPTYIVAIEIEPIHQAASKCKVLGALARTINLP